jgi:protein TonB
VDVIVLSGEAGIFEAVRKAVAVENSVWHARSTEETTELLVSGHCGVVVLDLGTVALEPVSFVQLITRQFPDVVVIAAGRQSEQTLLATLVGDGLVYRFMHKPLSAQRAGMFLDAAMRHHVERRTQLVGLHVDSQDDTPPRHFAPWLRLVAGLVVAALLVAVLLYTIGERRGTTPTSDPDAQAAAPVTSDPSSALLAQARTALEAGRYEAPQDDNALDLYRAVLLARPDDAEARAGLTDAATFVLAHGQLELRAGRREEARRLTQRVLAVDPANGTALQLMAELDAPIEPPASPPDGAAPMPGAVTTPPGAVVASTPSRDVAATAPAPVAPTPPVKEAVKPPPAAMTAAAPAPPVTVAKHAVTPAQTRPRAAPTAVVASQVPQRAAAAPPRVPRRTTTPRIDPSPKTWPTATPRKTKASGSHVYGAPISSGHPIAGYVKSPPLGTLPPPAPTAALSRPAGDAIDAGSIPARPATSYSSTAPTVPREPEIAPLERISFVEPVYPPTALRDGIQGWVRLEFTVNDLGRVGNIRIIAAEPAGVFENAAANALARWRFKPPLSDGLPTSRRSTIVLRFDLAD